jgi:methyl halide transferase
MSNSSSASFWDGIYERGQTNWDLGQPTPVFRRLIASGRFTPGRMMVLGAGNGHDAREFARHGFEVTAVDFSAGAVRAMRDLADPNAPLTILHADIFELPCTLDATYDYVLEYVCFCAVDPERRPAYADVVKRLLKPSGIYIDLAYPLDDHQGGPPYTVIADGVIYMFKTRGFELLERERPSDSVPQRRGCEELLILQKKQ